MRRVLVFLVLAGCSSSKHPDVPIDASDADGAPDGPPDASPTASCPMRTQPAGVPEHTYLPSEVHLGDVMLTSTTDVAALAGIKVVSGKLGFTGALTALALPDLEVVTTDLDATGAMLTSISLPRLETVGGHLSAHPAMPPLTAWHTPRLESVGKFAQFVSRDVDRRSRA